MAKEKLVDAENFACLYCGKSFGEEEMISLCNEPFNGDIIICEHCGAEINGIVKFKLQLISTPDVDEEESAYEEEVPGE